MFTKLRKERDREREREEWERINAMRCKNWSSIEWGPIAAEIYKPFDVCSSVIFVSMACFSSFLAGMWCHWHGAGKQRALKPRRETRGDLLCSCVPGCNKLLLQEALAVVEERIYSEIIVPIQYIPSPLCTAKKSTCLALFLFLNCCLWIFLAFRLSTLWRGSVDFCAKERCFSRGYSQYTTTALLCFSCQLSQSRNRYPALSVGPKRHIVCCGVAPYAALAQNPISRWKAWTRLKKAALVLSSKDQVATVTRRKSLQGPCL